MFLSMNSEKRRHTLLVHQRIWCTQHYWCWTFQLFYQHRTQMRTRHEQASFFVTQVYCADNNSIYVFTEVFRNLTRGVPSPRMTWASPPSFAWCAPPCAYVPREPSVSWTRPGHWNRQVLIRTGVEIKQVQIHTGVKCPVKGTKRSWITYIFSNSLFKCFERHSIILKGMVSSQ